MDFTGMLRTAFLVTLRNGWFDYMLLVLRWTCETVTGMAYFVVERARNEHTYIVLTRYDCLSSIADAGYEICRE